MNTKLFRLVIISLALCMLLTSCFLKPKDPSGDPSGDPPAGSDEAVTYDVTFLNGDEVFKTVEVAEGETVSAPEAPTKEATDQSTFVFDGWYNGDVKWDFENGKVNADLTLSAKFREVINTYEVKILDVDGQAVTTLEVVHGNKLTQPDTPTAPTEEGKNFTFDGWYNGNKKWNFANDYVTSSMSLKPVFDSELIDVSVIFKTEDGSFSETVTVKYGETPECTTTPTKEGTAGKIFAFAGWDKEVVPAKAEAVYVAQFKEYTVGIGNTDTFAADTIYLNSENKYINACYNYSSISGSVFPIIVKDEALIFNVFDISTTGVLNIDLGSVEAGVTYYLSFDIDMKDKDGNALTNGFAYAFSANPNVTTSGSALTSYALLATNGANSFVYTPAQDIEHLYFCIRTQKIEQNMESTVAIDNVLCKEINLGGANISDGEITEDFSDGIVISEGITTNWYGNVKVYSPNLNATVYAQDGKLFVKAEQNGQKGLLGFYIDGIVAGKSYEISMDLVLYNADAADMFVGDNFSLMVYANNAFSSTRYDLYVGDSKLGATPTPSQLSTDGKTVTFKFTATVNGYAIVTLRANSAPLYAEVDDFSMKEVPTYFTVTFEDADGNVIGEPVKYLAGAEIAIPDAITKATSDTTVYTFDGWYNGNTKLVAGAIALGNVTYTAKFNESAREYTITYYNDDDTVYQTVTVPYGAAVELLAVPEKDGNNGVWVGDVYSTMPAQNISYKASYTVVSYTATVTLNGETKEYEFTADNRAGVLALILAGFENNAQYTYTHTIPEELPLEDCEYNVVRTVNKYEISFVVDGDVAETLTLEYGAIPAPATPSKEGFTFKGWTPEIATVTGKATYTAVFTANSLDLTEGFENGSISGKNYAGTNFNGVRPDDNSSWELVEYNGSTALAVSKLGTTAKSGYAGFKIDIKPNTTYVVTLDLAVVGATTGDLSASNQILFEIYENANIGSTSSRLILYSNSGRWLSTNQKISGFNPVSGKYQVVFTTSAFEGESGYVYFTLRLNSALTEDTTAYIDNLGVKEGKLHLDENFDDVTELNDQIAKAANATVTVENGALKATCTAGQQGYLGIYMQVTKGKTYIIHFDATVTGNDGTDYIINKTDTNSASAMIFQNAGFDGNYRVECKTYSGTSFTVGAYMPLLKDPNANYTMAFTATEDGYVYIALRTNKNTQESYITVDNLVVYEVDLG